MGELLQLSRTEQFKLSNNSESGYHHGKRVFMKIVSKKKGQHDERPIATRGTA